MRTTNTARKQVSLAKAKRFIELLTGNPNAVMCFRTVPESPAAKRRFYKKMTGAEPKKIRLNFRGTMDDLFETLKARNEQGFAVYYVLNETDGRGTRNANVVNRRAVPLDLDNAGLPDKWPGGIQPHIIVQTSPDKHQCLFLIDPTNDADGVTDVTKRLALKLGADTRVCDAARVLRMPGFLHQKGKPFVSRIVATNEFDLPIGFESFDPVLPKLPPRAKAATVGIGVLDAEGAARLFAELDPKDFAGNEAWERLAMSVHSASDSDSEVEDIFMDWGAGDDDYADDAIIEMNRFRYQSFKADKEGGRGVGTLRFICEQHGVSDATIRFALNTAQKDFEDVADDDGDDDWLEGGSTEGKTPAETISTTAAKQGFKFEPMRYDQLHVDAMLDHAESAMMNGGAPLYQMSGRIVHPVRTESASLAEDMIRRPANALMVQGVNSTRLQMYMIRHAPFYRVITPPNGGKPKMKLLPVPMKLADQYIARTDKRGLPPLTGIIETPTLRRDGTLLQTEGYDERSGLLLNLNGVKYPKIPNEPTKEQARDALDFLKRPFKDFPFVLDGPDLDGFGLNSSASRSVMLSGLLTAMVRRSLPSAPAHGVTAPAPGTGKTLAIQCVAMAAMGREATATNQGANDEEDEKRYGSLLLDGDQVIVIDNCVRPIGGATICAILTGEFWKGRTLGKTESFSVPTNCAIFYNGNALTFRDDMTRRALLCQMDAELEHPEQRKFDVDLQKWVPANRVKLVVSALTVLRAFVHAGRPGLKSLKGFGSFQEWSDLVRGALVWLGEPDPCLTQKFIAREDPVKASLSELLTAAHATMGAEWFTAGKLYEKQSEPVDVDDDDESEQAKAIDELRDAIASVLLKPNKKALGRYLATNAKRIVDGKRLEVLYDKHAKQNHYRVTGAGT